MSESPEGQRSRKLRADALRNRTKILQAAKRAFLESGTDSSLDDIATQAGVGSGTLYRHFPNRDSLIEAVYQAEVDRLVARGRELADSDDPFEALRSWLLRFVDLVVQKHLAWAVLNSLADGAARLLEQSREQIWQTLTKLVDRAKATGQINADLEPTDLLRAIVGVSMVATIPDWEKSARRLVDLLLAGARARIEEQ